MKIAIQGIESSFHHLAVQKLFPETQVELIKCDSFEKVTTCIDDFTADFGVLAIENTIAGSILPNYNLIDANEMVIYDEVYLNIQMFIMAAKGQSIHDIEEIHSHPVALLQCKDYLRKIPPQVKIIEGKDTASEAKKIKLNNLKGVAAIAGEQVAEKFGLEILDRNIQSLEENQTRFVLIGKKKMALSERPNKATIKFELDHSMGSLSNTLQLLTTFKINLTKIQSLPIIGKPWQYAFFVDVLFEDYDLFDEVVEVMKKAVKELKVLGAYRNNYMNSPSQLRNVLVDGK